MRDHIDYNVDPSVKTDFTYDFVFPIQELYFCFLFSHVKYMEAEMNLVGMLVMLLERTKIVFLLSKTVSSPTFQPDSVQFSYVLRQSP